MRKFVLLMSISLATAGAFGCGHETRTVVRRETVTTDVPSQPVVVEKRTVITPPPAVPEERVYQEKRTTIEEQ